MVSGTIIVAGLAPVDESMEMHLDGDTHGVRIFCHCPPSQSRKLQVDTGDLSERPAPICFDCLLAIKYDPPCIRHAHILGLLQHTQAAAGLRPRGFHGRLLTPSNPRNPRAGSDRHITGNAPPRTRADVLVLTRAKTRPWKLRITTRSHDHIPHPSLTTRVTGCPHDKSRPTPSLAKMARRRSNNPRRQSPWPILTSGLDGRVIF